MKSRTRFVVEFARVVLTFAESTSGKVPRKQPALQTKTLTWFLKKLPCLFFKIGVPTCKTFFFCV